MSSDPAARPAPADLFSRRRRALRRDRAAMLPAGADFLAPIIADSLLDRLAMVQRDFADILLIGALNAPLADVLRQRGRLTIAEASPALAARHGAVAREEDAIDCGTAAFDLIVWPGGLDSVNGVAEALARLRLSLRPDGLLLGTLVGDGSLPRLRRALAADGVRGIARHHPQIDLAATGNLLQRIGFALPVVDVEALNLRYGDWRALVRDLRAAALTGMLDPAPPALHREELARIAAAFLDGADSDGRVTEQLRLIHFSGWAPHPDQPQPARRGSATASLAAALKPPADPD